jgi:hypothetical protein
VESAHGEHRDIITRFLISDFGSARTPPSTPLTPAATPPTLPPPPKHQHRPTTMIDAWFGGWFANASITNVLRAHLYHGGICRIDDFLKSSQATSLSDELRGSAHWQPIDLQQGVGRCSSNKHTRSRPASQHAFASLPPSPRVHAITHARPRCSRPLPIRVPAHPGDAPFHAPPCGASHARPAREHTAQQGGARVGDGAARRPARDRRHGHAGDALHTRRLSDTA